MEADAAIVYMLFNSTLKGMIKEEIDVEQNVAEMSEELDGWESEDDRSGLSKLNALSWSL